MLKYDGRYAHDEARISEDGKRAMLFGYQGFRIYDFSGNLLAEQEIPDPEKIYDQQFRRENGKSFLEVIWYDGLIRRYSDVDGTLLNEEKGILPEKDLYEEFYTDQYRIASSLHDAAIVYERDSDKQIGLLEKDAYLTYVTQMDDCLITEYVNAEGKRFGIILDNRLRKLAYLPQLCDVRGANLVFDDCSGTLRQCRIYSLGELIALGESY